MIKKDKHISAVCWSYLCHLSDNVKLLLELTKGQRQKHVTCNLSSDRHGWVSHSLCWDLPMQGWECAGLQSGQVNQGLEQNVAWQFTWCILNGSKLEKWYNSNEILDVIKAYIQSTYRVAFRQLWPKLLLLSVTTRGCGLMWTWSVYSWCCRTEGQKCPWRSWYKALSCLM